MRRPLLARTPHGKACCEGALKQLAAVRQERLKRLDDVLEHIAKEDRGRLAANLCREREKLCGGWTVARARLVAADDVECPEKTAFLAAWHAAQEANYLARVQALPAKAKAAGTAWLQKIVDGAGAPA